jgi:hypothetical protein
MALNTFTYYFSTKTRLLCRSTPFYSVYFWRSSIINCIHCSSNSVLSCPFFIWKHFVQVISVLTLELSTKWWKEEIPPKLVSAILPKGSTLCFPVDFTAFNASLAIQNYKSIYNWSYCKVNRAYLPNFFFFICTYIKYMLQEAYRLHTLFFCFVIPDELSCCVFISVVGYRPWTDTKCTK